MDPLTLLLADSRFPSGSYAHSLGLEQAVADGLRDVPAFIRSRQRLVAEADARFAVEARRAAAGVADGRELALAPLERLEIAWAARCPSPALRAAARRLGAQLLRTAAVAFRGPAALVPRDDAPPAAAPSFAAAAISAYRDASRLTPRPLALGVVAAVAGVSEEDTALLALYDDAATVASAALKLLPLDPAVTVGWLAELAPSMALAARAIAADSGPLPSPAAVAIELSAPVHLEQRERLFAS
jgi:urease accessory protein